MKAQYHCIVDITMPLVTTIFHGSFTWDYPDTLSNFCTVMLGKFAPLTSSETREAIVFHLKTEKDSGWSDKDLENVMS